jgi:hypothetical protein
MENILDLLSSLPSASTTPLDLRGLTTELELAKLKMQHRKSSRCPRRCHDQQKNYSEARDYELYRLRVKANQMKKDTTKRQAIAGPSSWQGNPYTKGNMDEIARMLSVMGRICSLEAKYFTDCYIFQDVLEIASKYDELCTIESDVAFTTINLTSDATGEQVPSEEQVPLNVVNAIMYYFNGTLEEKTAGKDFLLKEYPTKYDLRKAIMTESDIPIKRMFQIYSTGIKEKEKEKEKEAAAALNQDQVQCQNEIDLDMIDNRPDDIEMSGGKKLSEYKKTDKKVMALMRSKGTLKEAWVYKDGQNKKYVRRMYIIYVPLAEIQKETKEFLKAKKLSSKKSK